MANIDDVAKSANVSRSTVSRVLLNSKNVKESTRQRILQTIEKMNYRPNASARSLAAKKNFTIGIISGYALNDPFYSVIAEEICNACSEHNYGTLISVRSNSETTNEKQIDMMFGKVDAYVFLGLKTFCRKDVDYLVNKNIPVVLFKSGESVDGAITIDIDNVKSSAMAVDYLVQKGHKRIAFMYGDVTNYETVLRTAGYKQALKNNNITFEQSLMFEGKFSYHSAYKLAKEITESGADALFCESDVMAHGAIKGLMDLKYTIPGDIAVMGFDNIKFNNFESFIQLTTVNQPLSEMGRYIAETLIMQIEKKSTGCKKLFETNIIERKTV